jgi:hypothetical protein
VIFKSLISDNFYGPSIDTLLTTIIIIIKATRVKKICIIYNVVHKHFFSRFRCRAQNVTRDCFSRFYWMGYVGYCKAVNDVFIHSNRERSQTSLEGCLVRVTLITIPSCSDLMFLAAVLRFPRTNIKIVPRFTPLPHILVVPAGETASLDNLDIILSLSKSTRFTIA